MIEMWKRNWNCIYDKVFKENVIKKYATNNKIR